MKLSDIEQLRRDLIAFEKQRDGFYEAQRWQDVATMDRRIAADTNRLSELEMRERMDAERSG